MEEGLLRDDTCSLLFSRGKSKGWSCVLRNINYLRWWPGDMRRRGTHQKGGMRRRRKGTRYYSQDHGFLPLHILSLKHLPRRVPKKASDHQIHCHCSYLVGLTLLLYDLTTKTHVSSLLYSAVVSFFSSYCCCCCWPLMMMMLCCWGPAVHNKSHNSI